MCAVIICVLLYLWVCEITKPWEHDKPKRR